MKYVIAGNGVAGTTAAAFIRKIDNDGMITVIGDEAYPFYSRIRLIDFLSGDVDEKSIILKKDTWYEENKINLILNRAVTDIDVAKKELTLSPDKKLKYDKLLMATGGIPFVPAITGADKKGVFTLRTLKDAIAIREYAGMGNKRLLIIGGGVLGLEAGNALRKSGISVAVVEFFPRLLPRQMDPDGADILRTQMEKMGFTFYLGTKTKEIFGADKVEGVLLEDGRRVDCDMIIISAGIRPNAALAQKAGLKIEKGLIVNDRMETELPDIYAAGDLVQHSGVFYGIWPAAEKQGEVAGINMAEGNSVYEGTTISNFLKIAGVGLVAAGNIDAEGKHESIVIKDPGKFIYKKLVIKENTIIGAILYGDIKDMSSILKAIKNRTNISAIRNELENWKLEGLKLKME
ncbi:Nitrite reductase [NAD(P)H] large subunit [hydrothermal vent metagenome]|uniref:Nitrite reductase [NAD(P)H] large subunit n=1 Tax=hydrothermal vent metagenome TaxID=652676 RepID=A0A3B1DBS3_9ZZZZ